MDILEQIKGCDSIAAESLRKSGFSEKETVDYLVPNAALPDFLGQTARKFNIVNKKGSLVNFYRILYFDTPKNRFYNDAHNGRRNRLIVRYRYCGRTAKTFLEIKYLSKKKRFTKKQMETDKIKGTFNEAEVLFLKKFMPRKKVLKLQPCLSYWYQRFELASANERIRIDCCQEFEQEGAGKKSIDLSFVTITRERYAADGHFASILRNSGIRPLNISRFVLGMSIFAGGKTNLFKLKNRWMNKILAYYD